MSGFVRANQAIRRNDIVQVMSGRAKKKRGKVTSVLMDKERVYVEKVNMVKVHQKTQGQKPGGIVEKEASVQITNVRLVCPKCNQAVRVRFKRDKKKGSVDRVCAKCDEVIPRKN